MHDVAGSHFASRFSRVSSPLPSGISKIYPISLSYDWIRHLLRPKLTRSQEKMDYSSDQLTDQYTPFSTRKLGLQTLVLSFLSIWIFAVLVPSTLFSRTRSAHLTITSGPRFDLNYLSRSTQRTGTMAFVSLLTHKLNRDSNKLTDNWKILCTVLGGCPLVRPYLFTPCQYRDIGLMEIPVDHSIRV